MSTGLSHICWAVFVQPQHIRDASSLSCSYPCGIIVNCIDSMHAGPAGECSGELYRPCQQVQLWLEPWQGERIPLAPSHALSTYMIHSYIPCECFSSFPSLHVLCDHPVMSDGLRPCRAIENRGFCALHRRQWRRAGLTA